MTVTTSTVRLVEQGQGFGVDTGALVYDSDDGTVYQVVESYGTIHAGRDGDYLYADVQRVGDASGLTGDEWESVLPLRVVRDA